MSKRFSDGGKDSLTQPTAHLQSLLCLLLVFQPQATTPGCSDLWVQHTGNCPPPPLTDVESLSKEALLPRVQCLVKPNVHNFSLSNQPQVFCIFVKKIESKSPKAYRQSFIESAQRRVPCQHQRLSGIWSRSCWCCNH